MGFNQSSSSCVAKIAKISKTNLFGDLFEDVVSGCLAGIGIWRKPSPAATSNVPSVEVAPSNVYPLHPPLRVIRVNDGSPQMAGRMVISGRMADVCAELDRMVA